MSEEHKKYIPEGVFLVCDKGDTVSQLVATPRKVNLYGVMIGTDADNQFEKNISSFGKCKTLKGPCSFQCVEWQKTKIGSFFVNGEKPLLEHSEASCTSGGGTIKIHLDEYEAELANENNNESAFVSEQISSEILGTVLTWPFGKIIDMFCDDDDSYTEGVGRGFKKGMEGTWNFLTDDMWKSETWEGLGKLAVISVVHGTPAAHVIGTDKILDLIDTGFDTNLKETRDNLADGVEKIALNAVEDVKRGNMGEVGESVGQLQYVVVEAVVGSKGAGLAVKGISVSAKALIGAERLAQLSTKISKLANAVKMGTLKVMRVGKRVKTIFLPLRGELTELKNIVEKTIKYTKRSDADRIALRKVYDSKVRKEFLKELLKDEKYLKSKGISEAGIQRMKDGNNPIGYQVHHKLPLDDGGTNDFSNLVLIKNDPYHQALTNYQKKVTKGMSAGESKTVTWYTMEGNIYP